MKYLQPIIIAIVLLLILSLIFSFTKNTQRGDILEDGAYTTIDELEVDVLQDDVYCLEYPKSKLCI